MLDIFKSRKTQLFQQSDNKFQKIKCFSAMLVLNIFQVLLSAGHSEHLHTILVVLVRVTLTLHGNF